MVIKNSKFLMLAIAFIATSMLASCDDKDDSTHDTVTCEVATCKLAENAVTMGCDSLGNCVVTKCAENFKVSEDTKACVSVTEDDTNKKCEANPLVCDPVCDEKSVCVCNDEVLKCVPLESVASKCDPACKDTEDCTCSNDKCTCTEKEVTVDECKDKKKGDSCGDNKVCQLEGELLLCKDNPVGTLECDPVCDEATQICICKDGKCECSAKEVVVEDLCKDKADGEECGTNKTCQKNESDKLECKDKPAEETPTQPDPKE